MAKHLIAQDLASIVQLRHQPSYRLLQRHLRNRLNFRCRSVLEDLRSHRWCVERNSDRLERELQRGQWRCANFTTSGDRTDTTAGNHQRAKSTSHEPNKRNLKILTLLLITVEERASPSKSQHFISL